MTRPRISLLEPPYPDAITSEFDRIMPPGVPPLALFRALGVNPRVLSRVLAGGLLDRGAISLRDRELVIDRTCYLCGSEYEWGVHVAFFGGKAGLSDADVRGTASPRPESPSFTPHDLALLHAVDELHSTSTLSDHAFEGLAREFSPEGIVEVVILAGLYHAISFATNALRLPREPFAPTFPS